jgi:Lipocalin-like domain
MFRVCTVLLAAVCLAAPAIAETLEGRWKLISAEDVRASGEVARKPWGDHPVGSIVVQKGPQAQGEAGDAACYVQIMSSDTPAFTGTQPVTDQMKAKLLSSYIAYSGPCTYSETEGTLSLKVEAAWQPNYVGTDQRRIFHFDKGRLIFGTLPNTIRMGSEQLTRRLTLERVQ